MHIPTRPYAPPPCAGMSGYNAIPDYEQSMNHADAYAPPQINKKNKPGLDVVQSHPLYRTCFGQ